MKGWQSPGRRGKEQKDSRWSKQQQVKQVVTIENREDPELIKQKGQKHI